MAVRVPGWRDSLADGGRRGGPRLDGAWTSAHHRSVASRARLCSTQASEGPEFLRLSFWARINLHLVQDLEVRSLCLRVSVGAGVPTAARASGPASPAALYKET